MERCVPGKIPAKKDSLCFNLPNYFRSFQERFESFAHFAIFIRFTLAFLKKKG